MFSEELCPGELPLLGDQGPELDLATPKREAVPSRSQPGLTPHGVCDFGKPHPVSGPQVPHQTACTTGLFWEAKKLCA